MAELTFYDILRRPVVTEKSNIMNDELGQYVFEVALNANKIQIKAAVEEIFGVTVERVNTMVMPPKRGRRGRKWYMRTSKWKKAIVTLKPGEKIELFDV
ncbi:MAG: 50S ribosomal protein L23 [Phototrophicales bacterium]|nr:MAG: 50S ribosomal protein L23 [Phototrophicales bacterium]RMG76536.1 MAG: 50S ribosomal protein L23 [Chloroflexota bacterium]